MQIRHLPPTVHVLHDVFALVGLIAALSAPVAAWAARPPPPAKFLRSWDFGRDGEGEDTCTVRLRADEVIGGYGLDARRNCREVAGGPDLYAWEPTGDGGIVFRDATRRAIYAFRLDTHYQPKGWGFERTDAEGRLWIMDPTLGPPPPPKPRRRR